MSPVSADFQRLLWRTGDSPDHAGLFKNQPEQRRTSPVSTDFQRLLWRAGDSPDHANGIVAGIETEKRQRLTGETL